MEAGSEPSVIADAELVPAHNSGDLKANYDLKRFASIEILPTQVIKAPPLSELFAEGTEIYLPLLRGDDLNLSVTAAKKILDERMVATPHLAARSVPDASQLDEWLHELAEAGCNRLMLIAGDPLAHQGPYRDTLDVLSSGLLEKHGFTHLGVAAHPDGHVHASETDVRSALEIKKAYAREKDVHMWVVTQFVFDMTNFAKWLDDWEEAFDFLPIHVGLAGPSSLAILMRYAARCGVATSVKMLLTNRNSRRLMSSWNPDDQLKELYELCGNHVSRRLKGLHLFPFGGLESAARWLDTDGWKRKSGKHEL
ncbi:MAG: methylenetetrahydrofolate reductase [Gammaproteobacteria bacterium]|jgi:methylenetetrahydrofolate reductase (NADPH)|nr:methylenetetrahydrofolate reductase [Gammaproteobacteria bacterium]MBT3868821.1 methylenetetrahydrofolate reductase [Gammaproteobacteria bacterium]MBT4378107.1 methylenetetrahydrofolate reductase [Gammaproteobacteria bacterium]MBT4618540.1 methylenetetrahydrofolate reductase [Gammaproteobacteria bacterium]MBT5199410.1 methylenetetrahydrofolate reductase [Gammaproteobacteria bacterium]